MISLISIPMDSIGLYVIEYMENLDLLIDVSWVFIYIEILKISMFRYNYN